MAFPTPTVTIAKTYFDLLLNRATSSQESSTGNGVSGVQPSPDSNEDPNTIRIFKSVFDDLTKQSREYQALRQSLINGGVTEEHLTVLSRPAFDKTIRPPPGLWGYDGRIDNGSQLAKSDHLPSRDSSSQAAQSSFNLTHEPVSFTPMNLHNSQQFTAEVSAQYDGQHHQTHTLDHNQEAETDYQDDIGSVCTPLEDDFERVAPWNEQPHQLRQRGPRQDHTLLVSSLPAGATLKDVTSIIRGGRLIHLWLRPTERSAVVTFAEGAPAFLAYAKRNDIYIGTKRIEVSWSDWQMTPHRNMLNKLAQGHSRNLIIRNALNRVTEDEVRDHMEHIHNLSICNMFFKGYDLYISTSSLIGANLARICLLSRKTYKNMRIEYFPDECAIPLPEVELRPRYSTQAVVTRPISPRKAVTTTSNANRFNLLSLEESSSDTDILAENDAISIDSGINRRPRSAASDDDN